MHVLQNLNLIGTIIVIMGSFYNIFSEKVIRYASAEGQKMERGQDLQIHLGICPHHFCIGPRLPFSIFVQL